MYVMRYLFWLSEYKSCMCVFVRTLKMTLALATSFMPEAEASFLITI